MSEPKHEATSAYPGPGDAGGIDHDPDEGRTDSYQYPNTSGPHATPPARHVGHGEVPPVVPENDMYAVPYQDQTPSGPMPQHYPPPPVDQNRQALPPLGPPGQQPPPPMQQRQRQGRHALAGGEDLTSAHLIKPLKRRPQSGWRKALFVGTGHLINPGESREDRWRRELIARVNQPLRGCYKIAMLSLKGGVGKTTTTTTLGSTFASLRGDRVVAVDANPDRGTLSQKIPMETTATVRHLLRDADRITRYSDIRAYTSQGSSRLEILASEQDPAVSEAFSEQDYRRAVDLLEH
ncbi:MAG: MinD/ParA family ATP-binding protein, partial [Micromonosporaceae bacterium]